MGRAPHRKDDNRGSAEERPGQSAKLRPTDLERRYLARGLTQGRGQVAAVRPRRPESAEEHH